MVISLEEGWHAFHVHYEQPNGSATSRIRASGIGPAGVLECLIV